MTKLPKHRVFPSPRYAEGQKEIRMPWNRLSEGRHYRKTTLENGLRIVTEAMPAVRSLALGFLVDVGPVSERPEHNGLAHLTEHLLFQGTSNRSAGQIARLMDLAGGQMGGFTARDYTCYFAMVLDEHRTYALDLFGDLFLNSTFSEKSLQREKDAVLREIDASRDAPDRRVHELLKAYAWSGHALGRPIAGHPEIIQALTREEMIYFFHEHYVPDRIILAAAGQVEHEDFVAQARDALWRMMGSKDPEASASLRFQSGMVMEEAAVSQTYFALGIPAPAYADENRYGIHVLANILGGGMSSRLFQQLREERGLVYHVGAEYHAYRDSGMLVFEGSTAPEALLTVLGILGEEIRQLASGVRPVDQEEVWKATMQIRRQHLLDAESSHTRMSRLATQEHYFGRHFSTDEVLATIESIDAAVLQELTKNWLTPALDQAALAIVGPKVSDSYSPDELEVFRLGLMQSSRGV
jgi:predicted Zn-dependent peptidase